MIKAVLFDFDGTLVDTNNLILQSWQHTFRTLAGREEDEAVLLKTFGEPLRETLERFFPENPDLAGETYRGFQFSHYNEYLEIYDGILDMLKALREKGIRLAVVTSRLERSAMLYMDVFGIRDEFETIVSVEDTEGHKPGPEPCLCALERLGIQPEEAIMVGDSRLDILCAQNAGVRGVLVEWSMAQSTGPSGCNPEFTVAKPEDIVSLKEKLQNN